MSLVRTHFLEKSWLKNLPYSRMVFPDVFTDRLKYVFWRVCGPLHPVVRDTLLALRIIRHEGRQDHLIGIVAPHLSVEEFVTFLVSEGYGNHFFAWKDEGELVSLRYVEDFTWQYHLRVFRDGEVRAHYEYTPECYPILHMRETNMEARRAEFLELLGDKIIPHPIEKTV